MKQIVCVFAGLLLTPLFASVQVRISDPNTLEALNMTEIMVGSRVSLVVYSDANDYWSGGFFIEGQDRALGQLQARDKDPNSRDWAGSHFPAAGELAYVLGWKDSSIWGFDLYADDFEREPNDWFVIDYHAVGEGECTVAFYDHAYSWTVADPNITLNFVNTRTRDLSGDGIVNLADFAMFAAYWQAENCTDPNAGCYKADFSGDDGSVGLEDVVAFADFWLWGIPGWKPNENPAAPDPNIPDPNIVYDVTYAIVDVNSLSEITLEVGQSVTFYITKASTEENVYVFEMEVNISDPNLGWIDNTADDPNTTEIEGTAEILAAPRSSFLEYYGPGNTQFEGIQFMALSLGSSMLDGDMASFVYTAAQAGDVTLDLINSSSPANLVPIVIHQVASESQSQSMTYTESMMQPESTVEETVELLERVYDESEELQEAIPEPEWNEFIETVKQSADEVY